MIKEPDPFYLRIIADLLESVSIALTDTLADGQDANVRKEFKEFCSKESRIFLRFRAKRGNIKSSKNEADSAELCKTMKTSSCWSKVSSELRILFDDNLKPEKKGMFGGGIDRDIDKCIDHYTKCLFQSAVTNSFSKSMFG